MEENNSAIVELNRWERFVLYSQKPNSDFCPTVIPDSIVDGTLKSLSYVTNPERISAIFESARKNLTDQPDDGRSLEDLS